MRARANGLSELRLLPSSFFFSCEGTQCERQSLRTDGLEIGVVEWEHSTAKWVHLPFRPSDRGSRGLCVELVMPAFHITAQTQHRTLLGSAVPGGAWRSARPSATSRLLEVVAPRSGLVVRRHAHRNIAGDAVINTHCRGPKSDACSLRCSPRREQSRASGTHTATADLNGPRFRRQEPSFRAAPPTFASLCK